MNVCVCVNFQFMSDIQIFVWKLFDCLIVWRLAIGDDDDTVSREVGECQKNKK